MKFVYIAGPYTPRTGRRHPYFETKENIMMAAEAAAALADKRVGFFCPHLNSAHFEYICPDLTHDFWYELDMHFLQACDAILLLPGWQYSPGTIAERRWMKDNGRPIFYWENGTITTSLERPHPTFEEWINDF
jgi:nucleoside 2-deoxyribosyltransferase